MLSAAGVVTTVAASHPSYTAKTGGKAERCAEHAEGGMAHVNER